MKGIRAFVTGGAGTIGRELVARLIAKGAQVLVGDLKSRPASFPPEVRYRQGDLNTMTEAELKRFAPQIFFHLAATFERSIETYEFWDENFCHNVRLSHYLMTVAKDLPSLRRVVFASSYLIYDPSLYQFSSAQIHAVSLRESDPVSPRNLTGMAKLAHEIELQFLESFKADRFTTLCARIYRGYGKGSRDVISRWIRTLLQGESIEVYRPEGIFDYIYAGDSAEGLLRLAQSEATGVINLGSGRARRVQDVVDILRTHFPSMEAKTVNAEIPFEASQADLTALRHATGWEPGYDLERAIEEILEYEKSEPIDAAFRLPHAMLVTSSSRKVPLVRAAQDAARKLHPHRTVIAGDLSPDVPTRHVADAFWSMPRTKSSEIEALIAGCKERNVGVVLPTRDGELAFWAEHAARFAAEGITVVVSPLASVRVCTDKLAFARFGIERDLPFIPAATTPDAVGPGPYVVKERHGAGGRCILLNAEVDEALRYGSRLSEPIYQPFVAGEEVSVDAWVDRDHRVKGMILRRRDTVVGGESQVSTTFRDAAVEHTATRVLAALKLRGPVVMQSILDRERNLHVIECNARFGGASTTSIAAGLDSIYWSLLEAGGADVSGYPFDRVCGEVRLVRVPSDLFVHDPDL